MEGDTLPDAVPPHSATGLEGPPAQTDSPVFSLEKVSCEGSKRARVGQFLGQATPSFMHLTSRGLPLHFLSSATGNHQKGGQLLYNIPVGDFIVRQEAVSDCPNADHGCRGFFPHFRDHLTYCSFRNPRLENSVHGGDSVCSVETLGGRRKLGPKELLNLQRVIRADVVAAPGEEVSMDVTSAKRLKRAVVRASDWLKEVLEAKSGDPSLAFEWHVLASIQGGSDVALRRTACAAAGSMPVSGFWIGGLGYSEVLSSRVPVLEAVADALPPALPRVLPLRRGTPIEILQAVMLGIDIFEAPYPTELASVGIALVFDWDMPPDETVSAGDGAKMLVDSVLESKASDSDVMPPTEVKQLYIRSPACREDFGPIASTSPVHQYSRAYVCHLFEVRELLGSMLLAQHNLFSYEKFFEAIRCHTKSGSLMRYAAWFLQTQTGAPTGAPTGVIEETRVPRKRPRKT